MPTVENGYATVADLQQHFGDAGSQLDEDLLARAINATSRAIDRHCGRKFWLDATATVRRYVTDDPDVVWVQDIGSTTGLVIQTDTAGDGTWATTWATTDYELHPLDADVTGDPYSWTKIVAVDRYQFEVATGIAAARSNLKVTAKHGWSEVPDDVSQACLIRAAAVFKRSEAVFGVAGFDQMGSVVRLTRRDPDVLELLGPYIRISARAV